MLTLEKKFDGERCDMEIKGRVDTAMSVEMERALSSIPKPVTRLVLDLSSVGYICSSGLRILLTAHKEMATRGGSMELKKVPEVVMEVLEATGFSKTLRINPLP